VSVLDLLVNYLGGELIHIEGLGHVHQGLHFLLEEALGAF
jgi:hypothetical protein